jgi:hypothetical protein
VESIANDVKKIHCPHGVGHPQVVDVGDTAKQSWSAVVVQPSRLNARHGVTILQLNMKLKYVLSQNITKAAG